MWRWAYRWSSRGEEDQRSEVSSTLVAECSGSVDQSTDTIGLDGGTDKGAAPGRGSGSSFLGLYKLLSAVGLLRAAVGLAEERGHDCEGGSMVEDGA
jgi:hypothetical protein